MAVNGVHFVMQDPLFTGVRLRTDWGGGGVLGGLHGVVHIRTGLAASFTHVVLTWRMCCVVGSLGWVGKKAGSCLARK